MRILRSQYMKLRNNSSSLGASTNNKVIGKKLPNKQNTNAKGNRELATTSSAAAVPIRFVSHNADFINASSNPIGTNIKILFDNVDDSLKKLNIVVEFTDMNAMWLTRVYKTYENDLWRKQPRLNVFGKNKWFFFCNLCDRVFKQYGTIKSHLNQHMNFYPYVCKLCFKQYTNRKAATMHLRNLHNVEKDEWNDFLTS